MLYDLKYKSKMENNINIKWIEFLYSEYVNSTFVYKIEIFLYINIFLKSITSPDTDHDQLP